MTALYHPSRAPVSPQRRRAGFALLITITLLAFLVLLLVSLAALTRVETQVASNNQQLSQARQNALLALNIAVGQLQKYAGPDQRTTARADFDATLVNDPQKNGRWVGVYGSGSAASYADTPSQVASRVATGVAANGSQAKLLNWLVSGNEGVAFNPVTDVDPANGRIVTPPASFTFKPGDTVNLATTTAAPAAGASHVLLVGAQSVNAVSDRVSAPLVPITVPATQVPGSGGSGPLPVGRYAWWIGDEGAKARINLPIATAAEKPLAFASSSRSAIELMDGIHAVGSTTAATSDLIGTNYDPALNGVPRLLSVNQLPALATASAAALDAARKFRFHDLSATSRSVLSDTYAGGLKKDLSALLATGAASPADSAPLFVPEPPHPSYSSVSGSYGVPTWGRLRSFARTTASSTGVDARISTLTDAGVFPVLTYSSIGMELGASGTGPVVAGDKLVIALYPTVILWNPHTATLKGRDYEFIYFIRYGGGDLWIEYESSPGVFSRKGGTAAPLVIYTGNGGTTDSPNTTDNMGFRFIVRSPDILPGESLIFSINESEIGRPYSASFGQMAANIMTPGHNENGYAVLSLKNTAGADTPSAVILAGEETKNFRLGHKIDSDGTRAQAYDVDVYLGEPVNGVAGWDPTDPNRKIYHGICRTSGGPAAPNGGVLQSGPLGRITGEASHHFGNKMTFASSQVRWMAQANPRAFGNMRLTEKNIAGINNASRRIYTGSGKLENIAPDNLHASSGVSIDSGLSITNTTLFDIRPADQPLMSLGQLQHANLSLLDVNPAYPFGNSLADYRFKRSDQGLRSQVHVTSTIGSAGVDAVPSRYIGHLYDMSYLLNRSLWDRYFVSTVPNEGTGTSTDTGATPIPPTLPNPRFLHDDSADLRNADKAAAHLFLSGGFNINSTSEQAWRAVLGGVNQLAHDPTGTNEGGTASADAVISRFTRPTTNAGTQAWLGYRKLNRTQIAELAANIVAEIRKRGPFISLGDFVNRRLQDTTATVGVTTDLRLKGALQAALDMSTTGAGAINVPAPPGMSDNPFDGSISYDQSSVDTAERADRRALWFSGVETNKPTSTRAAFAPQYLTQADILSTIGAGLSARSDTFTVRTYGEVTNPVTSEIVGRAWCEAVVQRTAEPVRRKSMAPLSADYNEPATATATQPDFGRRFQIVSFRWLSPSDL